MIKPKVEIRGPYRDEPNDGWTCMVIREGKTHFAHGDTKEEAKQEAAELASSLLDE
jgi:hypothetical protein